MYDSCSDQGAKEINEESDQIMINYSVCSGMEKWSRCRTA